jgi:ribosomal protein S18 acetylase RimI-like enzyme
MIREYEPSRHRGQLRACVVELQEFERGLEPTLPKGEAMADRYLAHVLDRCAGGAGRIFVSEEDGTVVGFVGVLARVVPEPDEAQAYAYVSDLVVLPAHRRRGIGRALLERAEAYARGEGARVLRVGVLAKNEAAARLYRSLGFGDYTIQLSKPLR